MSSSSLTIEQIRALRAVEAAKRHEICDEGDAQFEREFTEVEARVAAEERVWKLEVRERWLAEINVRFAEGLLGWRGKGWSERIARAKEAEQEKREAREAKEKIEPNMAAQSEVTVETERSVVESKEVDEQAADAAGPSTVE